MRRYGILGLLALVGAGVMLAAAMGVRIGEIGSLEEPEWLGVGA